jgi:hypothetical protein
MKKIYPLLLSVFLLAGTCFKVNAQSLEVSGSLFIPQDSISFTYSSPSFQATDWIGIYRVADVPGGPASVVWNYIPSAEGTIKLKAPNEAGIFKAYLLCCDGYDIISTSAEFSVFIPSVTSNYSTYTQGDEMVFSYVSPKFSSTDWIGIYPTGTKPSGSNPSIDWSYLPDSAGSMTFTTALTPGIYDAYLLCCDGYDSLSSCTFEIKNANVAYVTPKASKFAAGSPIEFVYNDPAFASQDWVGIYFEGDDPALVTSAAWSYLTTKSGSITFPGTLAGGTYFAVMFCCNGSETEYARSGLFTIEAGAVGTYVKTAASVYPLGVKILVNYRDKDYTDTDWIGIYNKGEAPGGPDATLWEYAPSDSATIEFAGTLPAGDYVVYLLCCDGYNIKAKYNFSVAGLDVSSIVASNMSFSAVDSLVFYYNSPNYVNTDWIGIYHPGDVPGEINSITWQYLPAGNGTMVFHYPDDHDLAPGEYWAGLFCCDGYDLYAQTSFIVTEAINTAIPELERFSKLTISPNPSRGNTNIEIADTEKLMRIKIYNLTGQVMLDAKPEGSVKNKMLDLKFLKKGVYFIEVQTAKSKITRKLVMQ